MPRPLLNDTVVIAHRGGSRLRPENTLEAFEHASTLGVDGFECDVHLSSDDEVVVIHDSTLDRTTKATGPVRARTASELGAIGVPRLADVLDRFGYVPWIVEIKGDRVDVAERVVGLLRDRRATDRVVVGGFSQPVLDAVRRLAPGIATGASSREARAAARRAFFRLPIGRHAYAVLQLPFRLRGKEMWGERLVRWATRAGVPIHAWIIDEPDDMRRLLSWGVTGLISDRPDLAVAAVREARIR